MWFLHQMYLSDHEAKKQFIFFVRHVVAMVTKETKMHSNHLNFNEIIENIALFLLVISQRTCVLPLYQLQQYNNTTFPLSIHMPILILQDLYSGAKAIYRTTVFNFGKKWNYVKIKQLILKMYKLVHILNSYFVIGKDPL